MLYLGKDRLLLLADTISSSVAAFTQDHPAWFAAVKAVSQNREASRYNQGQETG